MPTASSSRRLVSLDAFRGFTIAAMILVNNPGTWEHVYPPLRHAEWHGWTVTDLIFPFFLFIMGVAMAFSLARRRARQSNRALHTQVVRRSLTIFALGIFLSGFPDFDLSRLRVAGVLTRIAVVYLIAALVVLHSSRRSRAWIVALLLIGYWLAMTRIPVPGSGAGVLSPDGNLAAWLDRLLLPGRMYRGTWDPEGLFSTLPAVATALLGVFTGEWLRSGRERKEIAGWMFTAGWALIAAGLAWDIWLPINKNLWTSSYVLFTAGAALEGLAFCYWLIDVEGRVRWAQPAIVYGRNPIAVFVLSGVVARLLYRVQVGEAPDSVSLRSWIYEHLFASWASPVNASLAFAVAWVVLWWALMAVFYRRGVFLKV